jgi:hypothetical protein
MKKRRKVDVGVAEILDIMKGIDGIEITVMTSVEDFEKRSLAGVSRAAPTPTPMYGSKVRRRMSSLARWWGWSFLDRKAPPLPIGIGASSRCIPGRAELLHELVAGIRMVGPEGGETNR